MKDFTKVFLSISALALVFVWGRSVGEKSQIEKSEYRDLIRANEELKFAKNELENLKTKLQNIADQAENKKTDELLAQILQVFLADLGLQIQNKEMILKKAQHSEAAPAPTLPPTPPRVAEKEPNKEPIEKAEKNYWTQNRLSKLRSSERDLKHSSTEKNIERKLEGVQLKQIKDLIKISTSVTETECREFLGAYRGSVKNINNQYFGSINYELKQMVNTELKGQVAWYNNQTAITEKLNECGKKIQGLDMRLLELSSSKYLQIYKIKNSNRLGGNFYETLPNGTTKLVGSFILGRTDQF